MSVLISNKMVLTSNKFWLNCVLIVWFGVLHVCDSYVLIQGDMLIESSTGSSETSQINGVRSKRHAVKDKAKLWDFGVVPYEIDTTKLVDHEEIASIEAAMRHWENHTCIIFIKRNAAEHKNFIRFTNGFCGCCSSVGKIGGNQEVVVARSWGMPGCQIFGSIVHEIGHAIGFLHEHQRPDRDDYIELNTDEGGRFYKSNFGKSSPDLVDTLDEPYDLESIMHYPDGKNSRLYSMQPKRVKIGSMSEIGQRKQLSAIDIRKANKLYKCPECGRTYFDQEATITSPEYYANESTNRTYRCEWRIKVMDGRRIRLIVNNLDMFNSIDCESDYLEVYDGYWHKSPLLGRLCGTSIPAAITSTSNHMIIKYISSHSKHRGFHVNYETFSDLEYYPNVI